VEGVHPASDFEYLTSVCVTGSTILFVAVDWPRLDIAEDPEVEYEVEETATERRVP
jgi:hypothetical protein